jgi:hypothetical protein
MSFIAPAARIIMIAGPSSRKIMKDLKKILEQEGYEVEDKKLTQVLDRILAKLVPYMIAFIAGVFAGYGWYWTAP